LIGWSVHDLMPVIAEISIQWQVAQNRTFAPDVRLASAPAIAPDRRQRRRERGRRGWPLAARAARIGYLPTVVPW
jgi:hypothetical protein